MHAKKTAFPHVSRAFEDVLVFWRVTFSATVHSVVSHGVNLTRELQQTSGTSICRKGEVLCALRLEVRPDKVYLKHILLFKTYFRSVSYQTLALHFSEGFAFLCFVFLLWFCLIYLVFCFFFALFFLCFWLLVLFCALFFFSFFSSNYSFVSFQSHSVLPVFFCHACFYVVLKRNPLLQLLWSSYSMFFWSVYCRTQSMRCGSWWRSIKWARVPPLTRLPVLPMSPWWRVMTHGGWCISPRAPDYPWSPSKPQASVFRSTGMPVQHQLSLWSTACRWDLFGKGSISQDNKRYSVSTIIYRI